MSGKMRSRKRVQKTVHLLQAAGCQFDAEFRLHYYGPYSAEVAESLDGMTAMGILNETSHAFDHGTQYDYSFNDEYLESMENFEKTSEGCHQKSQMEKYSKDLEYLNTVDVKTLELAATLVLYYRQAGRTWEEAIKETCDFKNESPESNKMNQAQDVAKRILKDKKCQRPKK
jgi:uncharacterized protein YwgA